MTETEHVRVSGDDRVYKMFCTRCGAAVTIEMPLRVADLVSMSNAFVENHSACEEAAKASRKQKSLL